MNRLYQIKGYKIVDDYIVPITELCKDSDEILHTFLMFNEKDFECFYIATKGITSI